MSDLKEEGFKSSDILCTMGEIFAKMPEKDKATQLKKVNGVFQLNVKNGEGKEAIWVIDLKNEGKVTKGAAKKPDVTMNLTDDVFAQLADGKLNGQKAFMSGKLKVKGNVMLATKLDDVLKSTKAKL